MSASESDKLHRNSIALENAEVLSHRGFEAEQYVLRVYAPRIAARTEPGMFAHLECGHALPMRRPLSIMRADPEAGHLEFLYKAVGAGTRLLAERRPGERISILGPIGKPFTLRADDALPLLIGGGVGIPPMVCLAERLGRPSGRAQAPFVVMGSEVPFPFSTQASAIPAPGVPDGVDACMPLLEEWGISSRLASLQDYPGCFRGYVTDLARSWLDALRPNQRSRVEVFACGPHAMLQAVAAMARAYGLPCQVSLEEFMACAVGGCAGCVVEVSTPQGPSMKRVCVDGPVFDAETVFAGMPT